MGMARTPGTFAGGWRPASGDGSEVAVHPTDCLHLAVLVWLTACAVSDARRGEIANALTLPALLAGMVVALGAGWGRAALLGAVLATALVANAAGWMGGGDVKIVAALAGLWPEALPVALLGVCAWGLGRRALGRSGRLRAVAPMLAGTLAWIVSGWLRAGGGLA